LRLISFTYIFYLLLPILDAYFDAYVSVEWSRVCTEMYFRSVIRRLRRIFNATIADAGRRQKLRRRKLVGLTKCLFRRVKASSFFSFHNAEAGVHWPVSKAIWKDVCAVILKTRQLGDRRLGYKNLGLKLGSGSGLWFGLGSVLDLEIAIFGHQINCCPICLSPSLLSPSWHVAQVTGDQCKEPKLLFTWSKL